MSRQDPKVNKMTDEHNNQLHNKPKSRQLSRRDFLRLAGISVSGVFIGSCTSKTTPPSPTTTGLSPSPIVLPTPTTVLSSEPTTIIKVTPSKPLVAIARAKNYDRNLILQQVQSLVERLGGLEDIVSQGDKVAIKVNLTSGHEFQPPAGLTATETYATHPEVVRALGQLLLESGASKLYIVEAVYDQQSYPDWGYTEIAKELNATLIDLNVPDPYPDFITAPVGEKHLIYDSFYFNPILLEVDKFVSVGKMKCHYNAGVTLAMKNLIGLLPVSKYRQSPDHWWRSNLHGSGNEAATRIPRIILDLNRARPIHFALIDGVMCAEGGEVPRGTFKPVSPGVLLAGKNPVATDAVATAVMSFDPTANPPTPPFIRTDNYLNLASEQGLGTNRLGDIEVAGNPIEDVKFKFNPSWEM